MENDNEVVNDDRNEINRTLLKKAVTYEDRVLEMYLTCVPFGFRLTYHKHRGLLAKDTFCDVIIEKCEII